jgi:predicted RNA-binding protein YlxR (DUF448 family)
MVKGSGRRKRIPQRTCVACRQVQGKRALVRIVRLAGGDVQVDPTGKLAGRGAYLCSNQECWNLALTQRRLDSALKIRVSDEALSLLAKFAQALPERIDDVGDESPGGQAG